MLTTEVFIAITSLCLTSFVLGVTLGIGINNTKK